MARTDAVKKAKSVFSTLIELSKRGEEVGEQNVDYALALSFEGKDEALLEIDKDIICRTINGQACKAQDPGTEAVCRPDPEKDDRVRHRARRERERPIWAWPWPSRHLRTER